MIGFFDRLARPLLRAFDPEDAHSLAIKALRFAPGRRSPAGDSRLTVRAFGLNFPNPVGIAPGFDKHAEVADALLGLGFGFVEIGTVTPLPQQGNPRPRVFRLEPDQAVINRLGFNSHGGAAVLARLAARAGRGGIVGVNVGANKDSSDRSADYVRLLEQFAPVASYVTVNISSPNTPGLRGLQMNLQAPIFQNRDFRLAVQHLLNFDRLNRNLSYGETFRKRSFFDGTEFANPDVKAYPFDPAKAVEHLERAGYKRRDVQAGDGLWAQLRRTLRGVILTRSDTDEIRVNDKGEKASFTVLYYSKANQGHLTVIQEDFRRAGVDMRLQLMEPGAAFTRGLERKFEMMLLAMTSGLYPEPRQYLHTDFKNSLNNNDFWGFGTQEVDDLIKIYEENLDADARRQALFRVDQIVHDEAFYLPFWDVPFLRMVHWDYLQLPEFYLPRRTEQPQDWLVYWIDPDKKAVLEVAMREGKAYPVDEDPDKDFFNVKQKYQ